MSKEISVLSYEFQQLMLAENLSVGSTLIKEARIGSERAKKTTDQFQTCLSYLKILERVVANRLEEHLESNSLHDDLQSAHRACHSTETALLRVHHDITLALDNNSCAVLVMLDLSAAFDAIDHPILMERLQYSHGITGQALTWINSYLSDRSQSVNIGNIVSTEKILSFGVPQGSVLGPKKYCMFSKPIGQICKRHNMSYHCYADDTQAYLVIKPIDNWIKHDLETELTCFYIVRVLSKRTPKCLISSMH
jgi:hypothetical protein